MNQRKNLLLVILFTLLLVMTGCNDGKALSPQEQFGDNAHYFMGLKYLQEGQKEEALSQFKKGVKKSDDFFAEKCLEILCQLASENERKVLAHELAKQFPSYATQLQLVKILSDAGEYGQIVSITGNDSGIEAAEKPDELIYLRLLALEQDGKQGFAGEIEDWFFHSPITSFHKKYFDTHKDSLLSSLFSEEVQQCIRIRIAVYQREYGQAVNLLAKVLETQEYPTQWLVQQPEELLVDIGKTCLYGTNRLVEVAQFLDESLDEIQSESPSYVAFYLNFYAGRLYDKGLGTGNKKALEKFLAAMEAADTPAQYDNALWYYFSTQLKISSSEAEAAMKEYIHTIHDATYYSDFFETLILRYFTERNWSGVLKSLILIRDYATQEVVSQYAYLAGRLVQLGLVDLKNFSVADLQAIIDSKVASEVIEEDATEAEGEEDLILQDAVSQGLFSIAYGTGGELYYRLLAATQLDYSPAVVRQSLYQTKVLDEFVPEQNLETLLEGLMVFDLPDYIYPVWKENSSKISLEMAQRVASFLSLYGVHQYSAQGLRLMSNAIFHADTQTTREMYQLAYPRLYSQEIATAATDYNLPEYLIYGLIRSESFFDAAVSSHAGAVGLAQLMPATAGDIARKLKMEDFDLQDPGTSVNFGSFYLAELIGRLDNSIIDALYSYNAGITNVRKWKRLFPDLPPDLTVELIPFTETRNYGKKIVSASAVYGDLYFEIPHKAIVEKILFGK
ncbi:MAG: lytic transglycosylase domain-containing protein [Spirochaetaceae bacterium]|nr:lytic transglycosylase domain-containing protein [Spirochaetaceae bacterium]